MGLYYCPHRVGHYYGFCITGHMSVERFQFFFLGNSDKASVAALSPAPVMGFQKKDNPEEAIKKRPEFFLA